MKLKDWSERLIWATVVISVVRYAATFAASDVGQIIGVWSEVLTFFLTLTGIGMGILDTIGGGLLFNGWSRVFPKVGSAWSLRFKILTTCVFSLLVSGLFILVPFSMSRLAHESVLDTLGGKESFWAWTWAFMVNVIPYVLIAGVFTGNKMVVALESEEGSETSPKPSERPQESKTSLSETFRNFPKEKDWRNLEPMLTREQAVGLVQLNPVQRRELASYLGVTEKTISNWAASVQNRLDQNKE